MEMDRFFHDLGSSSPPQHIKVGDSMVDRLQDPALSFDNESSCSIERYTIAYKSNRRINSAVCVVSDAKLALSSDALARLYALLPQSPPRLARPASPGLFPARLVRRQAVCFC